MFVLVIQVQIWWEKSVMDKCPGVIFTFENLHFRLNGKCQSLSVKIQVLV